MVYFKKLIKLELFWILLLTPIFIDFFISLLNGNLEPLSPTRYLNKILLVLRANISYYATIVAIGLSYMKYLSDEKEHEENKKNFQEQILAEEIKANQLKEIELENYRDQFRPTFIRKDNELVLLMKTDNLFLQKVFLYTTPYTIFRTYNYLKHGETIQLKDGIKNYYITGETIIGEKIIFGNILNDIQVYKALKIGCSPIETNDVFLQNNDENFEKFLDNWTTFNNDEINNLNSEEEFIRDSMTVDKIFMLRTKLARNMIDLYSFKNQIKFYNIRNIKELINKSLEYLSSSNLSYEQKKDILRLLNMLLSIGKNKITINTAEINDEDRSEIIDYIKADSLISMNAEIPAIELFEIVQRSNDNFENITSKLIIFSKYLKVEKSINSRTFEFTDLLLLILEGLSLDDV
jgi:hypothetical protein